MTRHAVIIGAGIGGLSAAVALRAQGWSVEVHERAHEIPAGGTALGMWPEAMTALDDLGVGDRVRERSVLSRGASILSPSGGVMGRIPDSRQARLVSRGRLLYSLHDALPSGTVRWATPLRSGDDLPDADLVAGADGIHSIVRSTCWGASPAERPLGTVAYRGVVAGNVGAVSETWGRGALFGITPSSDDSTNWFACIRADMITSTGLGPATELRERFSTWHPGVLDVVTRIDDDGVDRRELYDVSLPHPFVQHNVALLGDAAHAMAPNLGRGACESLIDAVVLAAAISSTGDLQAGLRRYDRARRRRTRTIVAAARTVNRVATARRGLRLRDGVVRVLLRGDSGARS